MASKKSPWFRFYEEVVDDPKVQRLPPEIFKGWVNLLCMAKRHDGQLPDVSDLAFGLRMSEAATAKLVETLVSSGLLEQGETGLTPHNWSARQYKGDVSTDRVRRYRRRSNDGDTVSRNVSSAVSDPVSCNGDETVTETPPDTESETETESEGSVPDGTDAGASPDDALAIPLAMVALARDDPKAALFQQGLAWLASQTDKPPRSLKSLLGRWLKLSGNDDRAVYDLLAQAQAKRIADPVSWVTAALSARDDGEPDVAKALANL